jgi:hypothetical protein
MHKDSNFIFTCKEKKHKTLLEFVKSNTLSTKKNIVSPKSNTKEK